MNPRNCQDHKWWKCCQVSSLIPFKNQLNKIVFLLTLFSPSILKTWNLNKSVQGPLYESFTKLVHLSLCMSNPPLPEYIVHISLGMSSPSLPEYFKSIFPCVSILSLTVCQVHLMLCISSTCCAKLHYTCAKYQDHLLLFRPLCKKFKSISPCAKCQVHLLLCKSISTCACQGQLSVCMSNPSQLYMSSPSLPVYVKSISCCECQVHLSLCVCQFCLYLECQVHLSTCVCQVSLAMHVKSISCCECQSCLSLCMSSPSLAVQNVKSISL